MADVILVPPHSAETEEAVLGSLLIDSEAILKVAGFLQPENFYVVKNQWVYDAMQKLHDRREPIDLLTVSQELAKIGKLDEVGGESYIAQLTTMVPTALNVEAYGRAVESLSMRRKMITAAGDIARIAYDQALPIEQVIEKSEATIFGVSEGRGEGQMVPIRKAVSDFFERIEFLHEHKDEPLGIPSGYGDLDKMTGGLQRGDLIIIAARPGVGKTSLMLNMAYNAAHRHRQRVAIFSLEMSNEQLVQRFVAGETGIDSQRLRVADLREDEWGALTRVSMQMADTYIYLDDTPSLSPLDLRVKARRIYQEYGLDLIIVDYLQLMGGESGSRNDNRVQEISYISRSLKQIARELKVPLIAGSQLSRLVEQRSDKRPMLSDLRESGCLAGSTLITLADTGQRVPIRELVGKQGFNVFALDPDRMKMTPATVSHAFSTGIKPVFKMTTRLGRTITATANHPFRAWSGWKRLDALAPGERIAMPRRMCTPAQQTMTLPELALLGHLIGDGCTLSTHAIQYTTRERDLAEQVASLATDVFGADVQPRISAERQWFQVYLSSTRRHTHGVRSAIAEWLDSLGVWNLRSHEKRVPEQVFSQPAQAIAAFLRHLWATDGCVRMRVGKTIYPAVYYASSSERLARDVQSLLLRIGINARIKRMPQAGKGRDQFHVIVSGKPDLMMFAEHIGAIGHYKSASLAEIQLHLAQCEPNTNRDVIPKEVWNTIVRPAMQDNHVTHRALHERMNMAYAGMTVFSQNISRERALRVAAAVQSDTLLAVAQSDVYWDEVVSVEPAGEEEVFDLTVPGPHNFVANDIFAHNSIEQDADIVMFIYRDELYNPDTEFKNIAEISVQKNRNGPTGKANLFFDKRLTAFKNLAKERVEL
jgi:replicative DNA helicase